MTDILDMAVDISNYWEMQTNYKYVRLLARVFSVITDFKIVTFNSI